MACSDSFFVPLRRSAHAGRLRPALHRREPVKGTNLRPWSQGDDNGLCGLFATINAVRWLWPELRRKKDGEEPVAALALNLVQDRLDSAQFKALYSTAMNSLSFPSSWAGHMSGFASEAKA